ncbi:MAG TPA: hypothetical protein VGO67_08190 [Verrucomicrobiae bacterium]|jgi:hypothetical protein
MVPADSLLVSMNRSLLSFGILFLLTLFGVSCAFGQNSIKGIVTSTLGDIAETKKRAEAGDAASQVAYAYVLLSRVRNADALSWFLKAANQGDPTGQYEAGRILLMGAPAFPLDQSVQAEPASGLRWTFAAVTNHSDRARLNMSVAVGRGLGTPTDPIGAYAWLIFASETATQKLEAKIQMNNSALNMTTVDVERARALAAQFSAGHLQLPPIQVIPDGDPNLKLRGVTIVGKSSIAIINSKSMSEGESAVFQLKTGAIKLSCLKIYPGAVSILIDGENEPRVLKLSH